MKNPNGNRTKADKADLKADSFQTPPYALKPLLRYVPLWGRIWESACGEGYLVRGLSQAGYRDVHGTDIAHDPSADFLVDTAPRLDWDVQVTNPPYSRNKKWLARSIELGKPFALLMPAWFEQWNCTAIRDHGLEILMPIQRINFLTPTGQGAGAWFKTCWYTRGLSIGQRLTIVDLEPERGKWAKNQRTVQVPAN